MSATLRRYLFETYATLHNYSLTVGKNPYIQIDDQDDYDDLSNFCNIFVTVKRNNRFEVELLGKMPITRDIADLVEIYHGSIDIQAGKITLLLRIQQIEVLLDMASLIRKTAGMGNLVGNEHWHKYCARTIGSLNRFVRGIKEYITLRQKQLL